MQDGCTGPHISRVRRMPAGRRPPARGVSCLSSGLRGGAGTEPWPRSAMASKWLGPGRSEKCGAVGVSGGEDGGGLIGSRGNGPHITGTPPSFQSGQRGGESWEQMHRCAEGSRFQACRGALLSRIPLLGLRWVASARPPPFVGSLTVPARLDRCALGGRGGVVFRPLLVGMPKGVGFCAVAWQVFGRTSCINPPQNKKTRVLFSGLLLDTSRGLILGCGPYFDFSS